jgi:hypothetical protein
MKRISASRIGLDQGTRTLFSDFADDGPMWAGQGPREVRTPIRFAQGYADRPAVQVAISLWDVGQGANMRADISAERITAAGFELVFRTWGDTRIARIRADWLAIGPLRDEDDWEVG